MVCKERREKTLQGEKVNGTTAVEVGRKCFTAWGVPSPDVVTRYLRQTQVSNEWEVRIVSQDIGGGGEHSWEVEG